MTGLLPLINLTIYLFGVWFLAKIVRKTAHDFRISFIKGRAQSMTPTESFDYAERLGNRYKRRWSFARRVFSFIRLQFVVRRIDPHIAGIDRDLLAVNYYRTMEKTWTEYRKQQTAVKALDSFDFDTLSKSQLVH
jgi:hypothetical protein